MPREPGGISRNGMYKCGTLVDWTDDEGKSCEKQNEVCSYCHEEYGETRWRRCLLHKNVPSHLLILGWKQGYFMGNRHYCQAQGQMESERARRLRAAPTRDPALTREVLPFGSSSLGTFLESDSEKEEPGPSSAQAEESAIAEEGEDEEKPRESRRAKLRRKTNDMVRSLTPFGSKRRPKDDDNEPPPPPRTGKQKVTTTVIMEPTG